MRMPRGLWLLLVALIIGVLVALLPLPGVLPTIGYIAALIFGVVGVVVLLVDLVGGPRGPRGPHV